MELDAWSFADEEWRGFVLVDSRDELLDRHVFVTLVAGESFYPDALGHADFAPGSPLVLRHEPDNPFDPNAIMAFDLSQGAGRQDDQILVTCRKRGPRPGLRPQEPSVQGLVTSAKRHPESQNTAVG